MFWFLAGLLVIAGVHWYFVFNEPARRKHLEPRWHFFKRSKNGRALDDDLLLAGSLIIAVSCSTLIVAVVIVKLVILSK